MTLLGIDIGGSAVKGALVDTKLGTLTTERFRIPTKEICTPKQMAKIVRKINDHFQYEGPCGVGFPAPIKKNIALMAANIHQDWIGSNLLHIFQQGTDQEFYVVNDADAAAIAEIRFGAGRGYSRGVILMVTLGTGIGSAIIVNGELLPNCEFGHVEIRGKDAEHRASNTVRKREKWSWKQWAKRLQEYFDMMEMLISPDLIIIGGGVSKKAEKFLPHLDINAEVRPAMLLNEAGIIGAACFAADQKGREED